jgi:hypothetical protein
MTKPPLARAVLKAFLRAEAEDRPDAAEYLLCALSALCARQSAAPGSEPATP